MAPLITRLLTTTGVTENLDAVNIPTADPNRQSTVTGAYTCLACMT